MASDDRRDAAPDTLVTPSRRTNPVASVEAPTAALEGYVFGDVIGRGGIGEVVLAHDLRMGRDVAIKRLLTRDPSPDEVTAFLREARIQARLDHPAIPPVHELGRDADGRPYFTMKRLAGGTLIDLLAAPGADNRPRLLRAFADVCMAIEFAHTRGVVHRDLKPSNIMIGGFGDVYVLDWGLARVVGEAEAQMVNEDIDSLDLRAGDVVGTPGYMAPEQLQQAAEAGRPADIYALGSILFELLAGEPLHPRGVGALPSTIGGEAITSPARRRPDRAVPPELDALCVAMLVMDPSARPIARRVAERVQGYLDGDRDVAQRRKIATDLTWSARAAYNEGRRADAMRAAGRALALDPQAPEAAELVTTLMLEPPPQPPPELGAALAAADVENVRRHARTAIGSFVALAAFLPISIWNGIERWDIVLAVFGMAMVMAVAAWRIYRQPVRSNAHMFAYALGNCVLLGFMCRMVGPFDFITGITCVVLMSVMAYPFFIARSWLLIAMVITSYLIPFALEQLGVLGSTWAIRDHALVNRAGALSVHGGGTIVLLIGGAISCFLVAGITSSRLYRASRAAQQQLVAQAWHLQQLLPQSM
jgi:serine/threonine-protein kinase